MFKTTFKLGILLVFLAVILSACTFPWEKERTVETALSPDIYTNNKKDSGPTGDIKNITNDSELKDFLLRNKPATLSSSLVFGANNDELIKVEGNYIYALVKNEIVIINSLYPPDSEVVGKITLNSRPLGILVFGQRLAVYGVDNNIKNSLVGKSFKRESNYVFFKIYDVIDPKSPKEIKDLSFEGEYAGLKLVGSHAYLMTATNISYSENEPLTPRILDKGQVIGGDCQDANNCIKSEVSYFDYPYNDYYYLSASAISLSDVNKTLNVKNYLLDSSQVAYTPDNNLYLTFTQSISEHNLQTQLKREQIFDDLSSDSQAKIKEIESLSDSVLSASEKLIKIGTIINVYVTSLSEVEKNILQSNIDTSLVSRIKENINEIEKTAIYKFSFDAGKIEYQARGNFFGVVVKNGIAVSNNYLRIITTRNEMWSKLFKDSDKTYSNVYVLDDGLRLAGKLENIATQAEVRSANFMGDRAYLSTAKIDNPLYVVDFSDNSKPTILGAVQIPSYSSHIYQANDKGDIILGFGRDVASGDINSISKASFKLSLFDFSDLQNPKELNSYIIGDGSSYSFALDDARALYSSIEKKTVSVPVALYGDGGLSFSGTLVFSTANNSLSLLGRIDHSLGGKMSAADYWQGFSYYDNTVRRQVISAENLLTYSNKFLKVNKLTDLAVVKSFLLTPGADDDNMTEVDKIPESLNDNSSSSSETQASSSPEFSEQKDNPSDYQLNKNSSSTPPIDPLIMPESLSEYSGLSSTSSTSTEEVAPN